MVAWTLYDFDAHWPEFWAAWTDDIVQDVLGHDMAAWCERHAPRNCDGSVKQWRPGEPLWHLSRTDFWDEIISEQVEAHLDSLYPDPYGAYKRTMEAQFLPVVDPDTFSETILRDEWMAMYNEAYDDYAPKRGTLESLVLICGKNYMTWALAFAASILFPDSDVVIARNGSGDTFALVPDKGLVLDVVEHFMRTRLKMPSREHKQYNRMKFRFLVYV
jgi:hypothetical protein